MADQNILDIADQFRAALLKKERAAAVRLVKAYGSIWNRLSKQLATLVTQIEDARAKGETVNQAWLFRQQRYRALLDQVTKQMSGFADVAEREITGQQRQAVRAALSDSQRLLLTAAERSPGIEAAFNRVPVAAVENIVGFLGNGSPLKTLLGALPRDARQKVADGLVNAVAQGWGAAKTAREIREGLGGNLNRALTIARTEVLRSYRTASSQTYQANRDVVQGWYWRSARGRRCCAACCALDGTFHSVDEPMKSHPRCRCVALPAVEGVEVDTGVEWFDKQPAKTQRDIIGTDAGYEAFKSGKLKLEDFVGLSRNPLWGDSYHQLGVARALAGEGKFPGDAARPGRTLAEAIGQLKPAPSLLDFAKSRPQDISVEYDDLGRQAVRRIFGRDLLDAELAHAVGAFDGSKLTVTDIGRDVFIRLQHEWVIAQERTISKDRDGIKIHNDYLKKSAIAPAGVAARSFGRQVFGAQALGVTRIETEAAGWYQHPSMNGYNTWPSIGYNAPLEPSDFRRLPREFSAARDVQDVLAMPGGIQAWLLYGRGRDMVFTFAPDGKSMRRFYIYLAKKQRKLHG